MNRGEKNREIDLLSHLREEDRDRYLTIILCPTASRWPLTVLAAFNLELAKIPLITRESIIGHIRLQWWQDRLSNIKIGQDAVAHPLLRALAPMLRNEARFFPLLQGMISSREMELQEIMAPAFDDFVKQADESAGNLLRASLLSIDPAIRLEEISEPLSKIAFAYAAAGRLRSVPFDALRGRVRIPTDLIAQAGLSVNEFLAIVGNKNGRVPNPSIAHCILALVSKAEAALAEARQFPWRKNALPAILTARLAARYLREIRAIGGNLHDSRFPSRSSEPPFAALASLIWARISKRF